MEKSKPQERLKLMRWAAENFGPVDMNENVTHVIELIREIQRLRNEVNELREELSPRQRTQDINYDLLNPDFDGKE